MDSETELAIESEEAAGCTQHKINNALAVIKVKTYLILKNARAGTLRASDLEKNMLDISAKADRIAELTEELRQYPADSRI